MLDRNSNSIDELFKQGLNEASMPVSNKAWASISTELENDRLRKRLAWYQMAAGFALLMLLSIGLWTLLDNSGSQPAVGAFADAKGFDRFESLGNGPDYCDPNPVLPVEKPATQFALANTKLDASQIEAPQKQGKTTTQQAKDLRNSLPVFAEALSKQGEQFDALRAQLSPKVPVLRNEPKMARSKNFFGATANTPKPILQSKKEKEFAYVLEDEDALSKKQRRWDLGATLSPDVTFGSTTPLASTASSKTGGLLADDPANTDVAANSPVAVFSTGLRAAYEFNERLAVRAGLQYSNRQTVASTSLPNYGKQAVYQTNLNLHYIELPVTMKYNLLHLKNFDYFVSGGLSGNMFLYYDNYLQNNEGLVNARKVSEKSESFRPSQANVLLSTGLQYRMFNRLSMAVEPGLRYGFKTNQYAFSQDRPVSLSLTSGLSYHF